MLHVCFELIFYLEELRDALYDAKPKKLEKEMEFHIEFSSSD